jgi:hypothetical protein
MTKTYEDGYRAGLEAAARECENVEERGMAYLIRALPVPETKSVKTFPSGAVRVCDICDIAECHTHAPKKQAVSVEDAFLLLKKWMRIAKLELHKDSAKASLREHPLYDQTLEYLAASGIKVEG